MLKYSEALTGATRTLKKIVPLRPFDSPQGFGGQASSAFLEVELLLMKTTGKSKEKLLAWSETSLPKKEIEVFKNLLAKRLKGQPSAYLLGKKEFYGLEFLVSPNVFIPRPETELLVEETFKFIKWGKLKRVLDVGTGTGIIALTLFKLCPNLEVVATDISPISLKMAQKNTKRLNIKGKINFIKSDLLKSKKLLPYKKSFDLICANLPYLKTEEIKGLPDPKIALDGGKDGLQIIKKLLSQAPKYLRPGGSIILEIGFDQAKPLKKLVRQLLPQAHLTIKKDLAGLNRLAVIKF